MDKNKYDLNAYFGIYFLYVIYIWMWDFCSFCEYYLGVDEQSWINAGISLVGTMILAIYVKKYFRLQNNKKSLTMNIMILLMLLSAIIRCLLPDLSFDASQMHFARMYPGFFDNIGENVFSYGLGSYMWFLGDRLFFIPYLLLGYRLAPIINVMVNIISYLIVIDILKLYFPRNIGKGTRIAVEILLAITVFSYYNTMTWSMYMVDLLAIPLLLQMLKMVIEAINKEDILNNGELILFAVLSGFSFALKMTNFIFIVPLLIIYLFYRRKHITFRLFSVAFIVAILPFSIYCLYSFIETGNPIFPTYNTIFKSEYYPNYNFKDVRWGPKNLLEVILWPIVTLVGPFGRLSELAPPLQCMPIVGIIAGIILIIISRRTSNFKKFVSLYVVYLSQIYLWSLTTGYARYLIYGEIFAGVILTILIVVIFTDTNQKNKVKVIITVCLTILMMVQCIIGQFLTLNRGHEWAWRQGIFSRGAITQYIANIPQIFRDKGCLLSAESSKEIDYIIQVNELSNVNFLINANAPKINLYALNGTLATKDANSQYYNSVYDKIYNEIDCGKRFVTTDLNTYYPRIIEDCNNNGVYIKDIEVIKSYFSPTKEILLAEVGMINNVDKNTIDWINETEDSMSVGTDYTMDRITFNGIISIAPYVTWEIPETYFKIIAIDEQGTEKEVLSQKLETLVFYNLHEEIDLTGLQGKIRFEYKHVFDNGQDTKLNYVSIINARFNNNLKEQNSDNISNNSGI